MHTKRVLRFPGYNYCVIGFKTNLSGRSERVAHISALISLTLLSLALLACHTGGTPTSLVTLDSREDSLQGTSEDGRYISWQEFRLEVLDRDSMPIEHPEYVVSLGGEVEGITATIEVLSSALRLPDDLFLRILYDETRWHFESSKYADGLGTDAVHLTVDCGGGRVDIGVARVKSARSHLETDSQKGDVIFRLRFERGATSLARIPSDAPTRSEDQVDDLVAVDEGNNAVHLTWRERNLGDYNNSGDVTIADVAAVALFYLDTLQWAENPEQFELIDGTGDGEITIADVAPIASNYLSGLSGYQVYRNDLGDTPLFPGDSTVPSAPRPAFDPESGRLEYSFTDSPPESGTYTYTVRPFSDPEDEIPVGIESLPADVDFTRLPDDMEPPVWEGQAGITGAEIGDVSILVEWGRAVDDLRPPVTYLVYLSAGDAMDFENPDLLEEVPAGDPDEAEHGFIFWEIPEGDTFTLAVRARDNAFPLNVDQNIETITVTKVENLGWLSFRGDAGRTGAVPDTLSPPLTTGFEYQIDKSGFVMQSVTTPAIVGDAVSALVALSAVDEVMYAIDISNPADPQELWTFAAEEWIDSSPAVAAGRVIFGSRDEKLYCLSLETGEKLWEFPTVASVPGSPSIVEDVVYIGAGMLSLLGGTLLRGIDDITAQSSPAVVDGKVFIGSVGKRIYSYDALTGEQDWELGTVGEVRASPVVADGLVMVGDQSGNFYVLTATGKGDGEGDVIHTIPLDGGIIASAAYLDGYVYVATMSNNVYAIDAALGAEVWANPTSVGSGGIFGSPILTGSILYVVDGEGSLYALDAVTGVIVWSWSPPVTTLTVGSPVAWAGRIYLQGGDNMLREFIPSVDFSPPFWTRDTGIISGGYDWRDPELLLRLTAGEAEDEITPPVRWRFFMANDELIDFDGAGEPGSSTIAFDPVLSRDYVLSVQEMSDARSNFVAHRAWYAARALDSAIPPNEDDNTETLSYTFPWAGLSEEYRMGEREKVYQFDCAYDSTAPSYLFAGSMEVNSQWRIRQYWSNGTDVLWADLLDGKDIAGAGYVDVEPGAETSDKNFYLAVIVPESGIPITRNLYIGGVDSASEEFSLAMIPTGVGTSGHNWGEVSIAVDDRGYPAVAATYWVDLNEPDNPTLHPYYHYLDDNDPPVWHSEAIDTDVKQTRYIDLAFKSDGTPVVALTMSDATFGDRTGLFVAERVGASDWVITSVEGGDYSDTVGKHLTLLLDESERPIIVYADLGAELLKVALPTGDGEWRIEPLGDLNSAGALVHHSTDMIRTPGAGPGDGSAEYAIAQFSQFGAGRQLQNVLIRSFGMVRGAWELGDDNTYWLGELHQPSNDSGKIVLMSVEGSLVVFSLADWGAALYMDSVPLQYLLQ